VNKECPHCGVDDFGLGDLFKLTLNYSTPSECRNCSGLVRNSGWSQFLTLLTTALLPVFVLVLLTPLIPEWIAISLLIALLPLPTMLFAKPVKAEVPQAELAPFAPDPLNDKAILIQGWNEDELRQILDDFVAEDLSAFAAFRIEIQKRLESSFRLTFPEDIHPDEFASLINYLAYPINLDPAGRSIILAGKTTLNSDFDGLPKSLEGKKALLYLPEDDEDYDVVFMQTESGLTFAKSFNEGVWRKVKDARLSNAVMSLTW
jgi:hypothetical protein